MNSQSNEILDAFVIWLKNRLADGENIVLKTEENSDVIFNTTYLLEKLQAPESIGHKVINKLAFDWLEEVHYSYMGIIFGKLSDDSNITCEVILDELVRLNKPEKLMCFNELIKKSVNEVDQNFRQDKKPEFKPFEVPKYIHKNILGRQKILFISSERRLTTMATIAISMSSNIDLKIMFLGTLTENDWPKLSSGVQKLKDNIPLMGYAVNDLFNPKSISDEFYSEIKNSFTAIVIDKDLARSRRCNFFLDKIGKPYYYRNFIDSKDVTFEKSAEQNLSMES